MTVKDASIRRARLGLAGFVALLGLAVCGQGCAEDPPRASGPQRPSGPPRAALDACLYKTASAVCYFEDGVHAIAGTCQERGRDWVCVPDRAPPDGPDEANSGFNTRSTAVVMPPSAANGRVTRHAPRPPLEAFKACQERVIGSACIVLTPRGEIVGRCASEPYGLACIPTDSDHRPGEEVKPEFSRR